MFLLKAFLNQTT